MLETKIALAPEQYLNALHRDQLELFTRHQGSVSRVVAADGGAALCAAQLEMERAEGHEAICCSAWLFLGKIAEARRWHDIAMRDVFDIGQGPSPIPRHIVQYWDQSDIPGDVQGAMRSWRRHYPEFGYAVLDCEAARRFIVENHSPALAARFGRASHPAMRSDIFRMAWLLRKGGYYIDADEGCAGRSAIFSLDAGLVLPLVVANEYEVQNNFIGATPDHPLISAFLANICTMPEDEFAGGLVWWLTGPGHMCRLIARHVAATLLDTTNENVAQFHEILSSDLILLPKPLQDTAMFEPNLAYKSTALSWQRARAQEKIGGAVPAPPNPPALFEAYPKT